MESKQCQRYERGLVVLTSLRTSVYHLLVSVADYHASKAMTLIKKLLVSESFKIL